MKYFNFSLAILLILYLSLSIICEPIDLSDYKYPVKDKTNKTMKVVILGTNDIHGGIFHTQYHDKNNKRYSNGGAINIYSYVKILKEDWGDQLLWLDGGDQFTGTMECMLSDGLIMREYFNRAGVHGMALGNHDFDFGLDNYREYIKKQNFPIIVANVKNTKTKKYLYEEWENVLPYKIFEMKKDNIVAKIGVIGLATKATASMSGADLSDFVFEDYLQTTRKWEEHLRKKENVDAVILLAHFGPYCDGEEKMKIGMWEKKTSQRTCREDEEIMDFLKEVKEDGNVQIDGVVGGHVHVISHHWISDIPVLESSGSDYFNILYLEFTVNKNGTLKLKTDKTTIEGPVPVCEKLWPDTKNCEYKYEDSTVMGDFIFHKKNVTLDKDLAEALKYWSDIIDSKLDNELCETKDEMFTDGVKETMLTNFLNDVGRIITESDFCFYNLGGIRSYWHKGFINEIDLFRMFPFNNTWVRFEMTGEQVYHMFQNLAGKAIYPFSGSIQTFSYKDEYYTMKDCLVWDGETEKPLEPTKVYKVCTNDFLANGGSGMGKVRKWYPDLINKKEFGVIRELLTKYMKKMNILTKEKFVDEKYPRINLE